MWNEFSKNEMNRALFRGFIFHIVESFFNPSNGEAASVCARRIGRAGTLWWEFRMAWGKGSVNRDIGWCRGARRIVSIDVSSKPIE